MPELTTKQKILAEVCRVVKSTYHTTVTSETTISAFDATLRTVCVSFTDRLGDNKINPVYVLHFCQVSKRWIFDTQLIPFENQPLDGLGAALAISGDGETICMGAPNSERLIAYAGAVYVFKKNNNCWAQSDAYYGDLSEDDAWFGGSVALDHIGETVCVGAPYSRNTEKNQEGAAYVFTLKPDFKLKTQLWLPPEIQRHAFGRNVAINKRGDSIAIESYKQCPQRSGVTCTQSVDNPKQLHCFFHNQKGNWLYEKTTDLVVK